jgi:hypothetical protein
MAADPRRQPATGACHCIRIEAALVSETDVHVLSIDPPQLFSLREIEIKGPCPATQSPGHGSEKGVLGVAPGVAAEEGVDRVIGQWSGRSAADFSKAGRAGYRRGSSVSSGEEVQNSVDIGGVADMSELQFEVEILFDAFDLEA